MVIDEDILREYNAEIHCYEAGEIIFFENASPKFYYQISKGLVKLNTYRDDGSEFIHSLPSEGSCFAETFLWGDNYYCINAVAVTETEVWRMSKNNFFNLIESCSDVMKNLMTFTADRMFYRHKMLSAISENKPSYRIIKLFELLKYYNNQQESFNYRVPFSRQQLASLTGLRVETVIRTVKRLESENLLKISNGKICI